jgi:hypothetical protein
MLAQTLTREAEAKRTFMLNVNDETPNLAEKSVSRHGHGVTTNKPVLDDSLVSHRERLRARLIFCAIRAQASIKLLGRTAAQMGARLKKQNQETASQDVTHIESLDATNERGSSHRRGGSYSGGCFHQSQRRQGNVTNAGAKSVSVKNRTCGF